MLAAVLIQLSVSIALAIGVATTGRWRRIASQVVLAVVALAWTVALWLGFGDRQLELTHTFVAFVGNDLRPREFVVESVTVSGIAWPIVVTAFAAPWAAFLWCRRGEVHAFWGPVLLAWSSLAAVLALEKAAAPVGLVSPAAIDRCLVPASIAACVLLAYRCRKVFLTYCWLVLFVTACRLPIALFSTLATQREWGTSLDVHTITRFANPFVQAPVEVDPGSAEQLGWLVWGPHLLVFPGLYALSLGGIAFAIVMYLREHARR